VYDVDGVRLNVPALSLRYASFAAAEAVGSATMLSNVGGVPLLVAHG